MTNTNNTFEIGARVERLGSAADYTTGRKGEILESKEGRCRIKWDVNVRTWVNKKFLRVRATENRPVLTVDELAFIAWKNELAAKYAAWMTASDAGTLRDDDNPAFLFQGVPTKSLAMIVKGEINAAWLAGKELANRGPDKDGLWVGFDKAEEIHGTKFIK